MTDLASAGSLSAALSLVALALVVSLMPLGTAFTFPCVTGLLSRVVPGNERGLYMGVQQTYGGITRIAFPVILGAAFDSVLGKPSPFVISAMRSERNSASSTSCVTISTVAPAPWAAVARACRDVSQLIDGVEVERDPVHANRGDAQYVQQGDVELGDAQRKGAEEGKRNGWAKRVDDQGHDGRDHGNHLIEQVRRVLAENRTVACRAIRQQHFTDRQRCRYLRHEAAEGGRHGGCAQREEHAAFQGAPGATGSARSLAHRSRRGWRRWSCEITNLSRSQPRKASQGSDGEELSVK